MAIRKKQGLTQTQFAEKLGLKSHTHILSYEKAQRSAGLDLVENWAERLGVNPLELLSEAPQSISMPVNNMEKMRLVSLVLSADEEQLETIGDLIEPLFESTTNKKKLGST